MIVPEEKIHEFEDQLEMIANFLTVHEAPQEVQIAHIRIGVALGYEPFTEMLDRALRHIRS